MTAVLILLAFVAVCVLAAFQGVDSRFDRPGRQL
jgi:hypothetical protein